MFVGVSKNTGIPKSSILVGVFPDKPSILGYSTPVFWKISISKTSAPRRCSSTFTKFVTFNESLKEDSHAVLKAVSMDKNTWEG